MRAKAQRGDPFSTAFSRTNAGAGWEVGQQGHTLPPTLTDGVADDVFMHYANIIFQLSTEESTILKLFTLRFALFCFLRCSN